MQNLTSKLVSAYRSALGNSVSFQTKEGDDYFRLEASIAKAVAEKLVADDLEPALTIADPDLQRVFLDVSALATHEILCRRPGWKDDLRKYLQDARQLEEQWTATLTVNIDKGGIIGKSSLDPTRFHVVPIFMLSTLVNKRKLPLREELQVLFPSRHKKTVFVLFDTGICWDGPFLCLTDWDRLTEIAYSEGPFDKAVERIEMIQQECSWQGLDRIYLPEFLEFARIAGDSLELGEWLQSLKGALGLFAIANVTQLETGITQLTFWGMGKRQIALNGTGVVNSQTAEGSHALYSWVYREVPHPSAALRISRNLMAQQLGADPGENARVLETRLPDIVATAKANYAAFVEEKLKDFFQLEKEISSYTNWAAEYLYKTLADLNDSLRKSVFTTIGVIGGTLLSTTAVQLNPMTYTLILMSYGLFLLFFNVWYLPREATTEFSEHLRRFRSRIEPYRQFLDTAQGREILSQLPLRNERKFTATRRLIRLLNGFLASIVVCLSGYDVPSVAKSFKFIPTWGLGRAISWFAIHAAHFL
jgi:hypothetical protein